MTSRTFSSQLKAVTGLAGHLLQVWRRVARWFLFRPKIPIWVYSGGPRNGKCCYIFWSFKYFTTIVYILWDIAYFLVIWYIFPHFGILYQENTGNPGLASRLRLRSLLYIRTLSNGATARGRFLTT
jgi:hypothetical protein